MENIQLLQVLSEAFGPSGFEEAVVSLLAENLAGHSYSTDAMHNLYIEKRSQDKKKPLLLLDAHSDEVGFMVQSILANGQINLVPLGGIAPGSFSAHSLLIRNKQGKLHRGIVVSKPVHFLSGSEKSGTDGDMLQVDVGASSRQEVTEAFAISLGDPAVPEVKFSYIPESDVCLGKAFDNRVGCDALVEVMKSLAPLGELGVDVAGVVSAQEEVGTRGAMVSARKIKPDLAIVLEGTPADDSFLAADMAQGALHKGVQIRYRDAGYIANPIFNQLACETAKAQGIAFQEAVRQGGGTNARQISLADKAIPTLTLGVPVRYVHTHHGFCSPKDVKAMIDLTLALIKVLDQATVDQILGKK